MKIEQCLVCKMVDETYTVIGSKEFGYRKSKVVQVIDFIDNYKDALKYAAKLNIKAKNKRGPF